MVILSECRVRVSFSISDTAFLTVSMAFSWASRIASDDERANVAEAETVAL